MKHLVIASLVLAAGAANAAEYKIDPGHSFVTFEIGHLGVSKTAGRFNDIAGNFTYNDDNSGSAELTIQAASVDTNHEARDKHLRSPDFLDVKQFPTITFKSTSFDGEELKGEITLHGVTKTVEFDVEKVGEGKDPWGGYRAGFEAKTTIKRSDFGVTYFIPGVTDETDLEVFIEGIRK
ncbi:YceI family protein [Marinomonas balearica]|uniref:Polyisoprenoid-binding protein YceI n=1 Tax=Marinomonas balearica TaxID=491947 RepID=A0A4R6M5F2_9GAMM|nr:YceI family protein [Marinomonas balearica]TDO96296.1 polyisoprenoid-binding protein YceI [Marinomonas balearica]